MKLIAVGFVTLQLKRIGACKMNTIVIFIFVFLGICAAGFLLIMWNINRYYLNEKKKLQAEKAMRDAQWEESKKKWRR